MTSVRKWTVLRVMGALTLACVCALEARAVDTQWLYNLQVLGGQYFFRGERGNLSGNVSGMVAPAMTLNERWVVMPSLSTRFQGTKQVVDLVGSGTLFQQQMDHRAAVKAVYHRPASKWSLKPSASYSLQLLKETQDETWFEGLFDYRMLDIGLEGEYEYRRDYSIRVGADYIFTHFPNYTSLESQTAFDFQGQSLARELVGDQVLDTHAMMFFSSISAPLGRRVRGESRLIFTRQNYPNQPIVGGDGLLTGDTREDFVTHWSVAASMPVEASLDVQIVPRLEWAVSNTVSTQNNYDARRIEYQPGYYNSLELRATPSVRVLLGDVRQPIDVNLSTSLAVRRYPHRKIQNEAGTYQDETLRQNSWMLHLTAAYPMAPQMSLLFNFQHGKASSNQGFQQFYSYNYTATNYLIGFRYEY